MTIWQPNDDGFVDRLAPTAATHDFALFDIRTVFDPNSTAIETLRCVLGSESESSGVAWIALPSPSGELMVEYVHGAATPLLKQLQIPPGGGLTGKVFNRGTVDWVEHYASAASITR